MVNLNPQKNERQPQLRHAGSRYQKITNKKCFNNGKVSEFRGLPQAPTLKSCV